MTRPPRSPRSGNHDDDPLLRDLFAALREEDRRTLPGFDRLLAEARVGERRSTHARRAAGARRGGRWLWVGAGALSAVVVAVVLALVMPPRTPQSESLEAALAFARSIDEWEAPTDAVLEIALLKMPDTVPTLDYASIP